MDYLIWPETDTRSDCASLVPLGVRLGRRAAFPFFGLSQWLQEVPETVPGGGIINPSAVLCGPAALRFIDLTGPPRPDPGHDAGTVSGALT